MVNVKNSLLVIAFTLITSTAANAGVLIEPHLGVALHGNADYGSSTTSYNGGQYGLRLGGEYLGFMAGMDYTHSSFTYKTTSSAGAVSNTDKSRSQLGLFGGYKFPILVRAWAGYYFTDKTSDRTGSNFEKGHGTELGVGFTGLPFLSVNLMYRMSSYDTNNAGDFSPSHDSKEVVLGVSIPFVL
jgi:hypothetical protein